MSYTLTNTQTFTATHAKHIAAKVATDLKRIQRLYGEPTDNRINNYETEIIELLKKGYIDTVTYGYRRDGKWIEPTLRYTAKDLANTSTNDDDPGRIRPRANIDNASFGSFLTYSSAWDKLTTEEKKNFKATLPFQRGDGDIPGVSGYFNQDKTYSSGGRALDRSTLKSY